jgi:hypothetical protein
MNFMLLLDTLLCCGVCSDMQTVLWHLLAADCAAPCLLGLLVTVLF